MAEIKAQGYVYATRGTVIEARADLLVVSVGGSEESFTVRPHDAQPGDYVWIYDDGQVEVKSRPSRLPDNVTETTLPTSLDGQDHS